MFYHRVLKEVLFLFIMFFSRALFAIEYVAKAEEVDLVQGLGWAFRRQN